MRRSAREIERLEKELLNIFPQVIKPFKDLHHLNSKNLKYSDLPNDPRLLLNKKYKILKSDILKLVALQEECSQNIPAIEEKLGPARHYLAGLRIQELELRPLDDQLDKIDLQEKIEKDIVERFKLDQQEKRKVAENERSRKIIEALEIKRINDKMTQDQKDIELKQKRKLLMEMLKVEIHKVNYFLIIFRLKKKRGRTEKKKLKQRTKYFLQLTN